MGKIVPLFAVDQPLVDHLCEIIRQLDKQIGDGGEYWSQEFENPKIQDLYNRIIQE